MNYITGRRGFIGSHLYKKLENVTWLPHETLEYARLEPFDTFYFLSAYGNLHGHSDVDAIVKANLTDLMLIFEQARKVHFSSFVYVSTSSVGRGEQTPYARTKRAAEEVLLSYDLPVCILRPYTVIGVGEQAQHLIPTLIRSCLEGEKMDFVPWPEHDFVDVDDTVEAILNLSPHPGLFEIRSGGSYTNQQVLNIVENVTGKRANVNIVQHMRPYDERAKMPPHNFSERQWGWLPHKSPETSIKEMVNEYLRTKNH